MLSFDSFSLLVSVSLLFFLLYSEAPSVEGRRGGGASCSGGSLLFSLAPCSGGSRLLITKRVRSGNYKLSERRVGPGAEVVVRGGVEKGGGGLERGVSYSSLVQRRCCTEYGCK